MNKHDLDFNQETLWQVLQNQLPVKRWLVGFSGGLDSTALLSALRAAKPPQPIVAIHVNHGLSPNADAWQQHCESLCQQWQLECRIAKVQVQPQGGGLEEAARNARYSAFLPHIQPGDVLLLGHHRDDQAETLLFRLMRGAGPRGLGAIVPQRTFGQGRLVRPLLGFSKQALETYAVNAGLHWISDESNTDEALDRNYLRHTVLPLLARRWPNFTERWRLTAEACQQADQLSQDLGQIDLTTCGEKPERDGWSVDWHTLSQLPPYRRNNLLRTWALHRGYPPMEQKHLQEVEKQCFTPPKPSSRTLVQWADAALAFYRGRLYLIKTPPPKRPNAAPITWTLKNDLLLPDGSRLSAQPAVGGLRAPQGQVEIRWRQGGERCQPAQRAHSQTLKKLFQEYHLEPWLRPRVPLIYINNQLAAVGDLWICKGFTDEDELGHRLEWSCGWVGSS